MGGFMKNDNADWLARVRWAVPSGVSLLCALALSACSGADGGAPSPSGDPGSSKVGADPTLQPPSAKTTSDESGTPTPVASLMIDDHVIEFYDFERGALISETGVAGKPTLLAGEQRKIRVSELVATWTRLAPEVPVPQALTDLQ